MKHVFASFIAASALVVVTGCERDGAKPKPKPDTVLVTLAPADVSADEGWTVASAFVTERRVPLEGFTVSFEVLLVAASGANPTYATVTSETDVNGIASVALSGLSRTGAGEVVATAMRESGGQFEPYLDADDMPIAGAAPLRVTAGAAASVAVSLTPAIVDPANGDSLTVAYLVRDAQGNLTEDPVEIATDHPGATILGASVENLTVGGTWSVAVSVSGRPSVSDTENFSVLPGGAAIIDAWLSTSTTDAYADPMAHPPVVVSYMVMDASGNDVTATANVTCSVDPLSGAAVDGDGVLSPLVVKGTFPVTCDLLDEGSSVVSSDTETLTVLDLTPPDVTILTPAPGATFASGEDFVVQVRGQDVVAVSQLTAQLVGLGLNTTQSQIVASLSNDVTVGFVFTAGGAGAFAGTQTLYAMGNDGSGNLATAAPVTINVAPFSVLAPGISATLVHEDGDFQEPVAISSMNTAGNPTFAVADRTAGGGTVWQVEYDPVLATSTRTVFDSGMGQVRGVAWQPSTNALWVSVGNAVRRYDAATATLIATITIPGSEVQHLVLGDAPYLYVADSNGDEVHRIDTTTNLLQAVPYAAVAGATGIAYAGSGSLFVSDFLGGENVYELTPDTNMDGSADLVQLFMTAGTVFGPNPDDPRGMDYKGPGGLYGDQLFSAHDGNAEIYAAMRDGPDANTLSDSWSTFLRSTRAPRDMDFHANGNLYVLFRSGNGLDAHIVELSGF